MLGARAGANRDRVETILRGEGVVGVGAAQAGADNSPIRGACGQQIVDNNGLMCAMKRAYPEVNDAGFDPGPVVAGAADLAGEAVKAGVREAQISLLLGWKTGIFVNWLDIARP